MAKATDTKPEVKTEETKATDVVNAAHSAPVTPTKTKWLVSVNCPTPLEKNPLIVPAVSAEQAWAKFCKANGISGTDHPKKIEPAE